jgi:hypothetical protein
VPSWGWEHRCQGLGAKGLRTHAWAWIADLYELHGTRG